MGGGQVLLSQFLQSAWSVTSTVYFACSPIFITDVTFVPATAVLNCSSIPFFVHWLQSVSAAFLPSPACSFLLPLVISSSTLLRLEMHLGLFVCLFVSRLEKTMIVALHSLFSPGSAGGRSRRISCCLPQARRVAKPLLLLSFMSLRIFCPLRRAVENSAAFLHRSCISRH